MDKPLDLSDKRNDVKLRSALLRSQPQDKKESGAGWSGLYSQSTDIDRRDKHRTVPMSVLNLGMPRTGTVSMLTALNILGFKCYHSTEWFSNVQHCEMWNAAMDAKFFNKGPEFSRVEWDQLLGSYSAVSADPPAVAFAEDLIKAYPEAKVILVERDIDTWAESFSRTIAASQFSPLMHRIADWDPAWNGAIRDSHMRWVKGWFKAYSKEEMDSVSRQIYRDHYALIRKITPPEMLLEFKLGDGWKPLCAFLGKDIPDQEFPRVNDADAVWEQIGVVAKQSIRNAIVRILSRLGVVTLSLGLLIFCWWWSTYSSD